MIKEDQNGVRNGRSRAWRCSRATRCTVIVLTLCLFGCARVLVAQISLAAAVHKAMENSPKVKAAERDVTKAQTGLSVVKDLYIPSVVTTGGLGDSYGITLTVPTIFTVGAQSLIYSDQQRFYLRAAHSDLLASGLALTEARDEVEEDAAITYINLEEAQSAATALAEQCSYAAKLQSIVEDRRDAGLDSDLEVKKAQRGSLQTKLAQMQMQDTIDGLRAHLGELIGVPADEINVIPESIPELSSDDLTKEGDATAYPDNPGVLAAEENAEARMDRAKGDSRYTWRPTITFGAQYGRVSPINDVSQFYNLHGIYNTVNAGIQIQFPIVDRVRKAAAKQSFADVGRAELDVKNLRAQLDSDRRKLQHSLPELALKAQVGRLDFEIAQNDLQSTVTRAHARSDTAPINPKDEQNAHILERQKYLDYLDSKLQYEKAEIWLLRQTGRLASWIEAAPSRSSASSDISSLSVQR